jgi:hypothetical protein
MDRYRTDPGHDLVLRQMAVAHNASMAILSSQLRMLGEGSAASTSTACASNVRAPA